MADQDALKDKQEGKSQKGNSPTSGIDNKDLSDDYSDKKVEDSIPEEKKPLDSAKGEFPDKVDVVNGGEIVVTHEEVEPGRSKESSNSELPKDHTPSIVKESDGIPPKSACPPSSFKETLEVSSAEEHSQLTEVAKDVDMVSDLKSSEENEPSQSVASMSVDEHSQAGDASKDVDMVSDSLPADKDGSQQPAKSNAGDHSQPTESTADVDMLSSQPSEVKPQGLKVESGATSGPLSISVCTCMRTCICVSVFQIWGKKYVYSRGILDEVKNKWVGWSSVGILCSEKVSVSQWLWLKRKRNKKTV
jgi:SWI/SNF related-matrix-associated actin-dependent regulator of chromatin subfamily C